jgi:hypothetical protein
MAAKNERALIELFAPAALEALGSTASARFEEATLRPAGAWLHVSHMDGNDIKIGRAARRREPKFSRDFARPIMQCRICERSV